MFFKYLPALTIYPNKIERAKYFTLMGELFGYQYAAELAQFFEYYK